MGEVSCNEGEEVGREDGRPPTCKPTDALSEAA